MKRSILAHRMLERLEGDGIEIGAFRNPRFCPNGRVRYVDSLSREQSLRYFPEAMLGMPVVNPDVVCPADELTPFGDGSLDFIVASHLLEHIRDPLGALMEWHRALRCGGRLFLALPDMRRTSDRDRLRTTLEHLVEDHHAEDSALRSRDREHYLEWARCVNGLDDPRQAEFWAELLQRTDLAIHFHCWVPEDVEPLLEWLASESQARFDVVDRLAEDGAEEFFFLLEKPEPPSTARRG